MTNRSRLIRYAFLVAPLSPAAQAQSNLPPCPPSRTVVWTDCRGVYTYDDWSKYAGDFKDDKRHGQGVMNYPDGQRYSGGFKETGAMAKACIPAQTA